MALIYVSKSTKFLRHVPPFPVIVLRLMSDKVLTIEVENVDNIDTFTSNLIQRQTNKWGGFKLQKLIPCDCSLVGGKTHENKFLKLTHDELNEEILKVAENGSLDNLKLLLELCISHKTCPSLKTIKSVLDTVRCDNLEIINLIQRLVKENDYFTYANNGKFEHYLAEAIWLKGDIPKALDIFETVFRENAALRNQIKFILKHLISDITDKSEANLINIIKFCEKISEEFNDFYPMVCVWQTCFISEWYTDQKVALELLEKHDGLSKAVVYFIPYVVGVALNSHRTEVVYRLLEFLLKYKMKNQYSKVLMTLLSYSISTGDTRSCLEIIHWSKENNVLLPNSVQQQFLMHLVNKPYVANVKKPTPRFNLKF